VSALLGVSRDATRATEHTSDLYARHGQRVYSFCLSRLRNREEAQDAAQTAFLYALGSLKRGVVPRNELAWLLTIADNVCRSTRRTAGRRVAHVTNVDVDEFEAAATSMNAETREEIAALRAALGQLPDRQRTAILLREWQGLSYADIAEQLDLTLGAVETLLFRARRSLMRHLRGPRARLGLLDLASAGSLLRSVLGGTAAKVAVGAATLAVVTAPVMEHELATPAAQAERVPVVHLTPRTAAHAAAAAAPMARHESPRTQASTPRRAPHAGRSAVVSTRRAVRPSAAATSTPPPPAPPATAPVPAPSPTPPSEDVTVPAPAPPAVAQPTTPAVPVTPPVATPPISLPPVTLPPITLPPVQLPPLVRDLPLPLP
jgi:RNA polymerase sigma factor (sigma-70 family)